MMNLGVPSLLVGKQIALVGAGPGGLTLARLLQMRGATVTVYERDASWEARNQGGSLDLHPDSGLLAISEAKLERGFHGVARPEGQHSKVLDKHGNELAELRAEDEGVERPEIDRSELRELFLKSLEPGTVLWGMHLRQVTREGLGYRLDFASSESVKADLVIGCDGAWSKVRSLRSSLTPLYSGVTFVETQLTSVDTRHPSIAKLVGSGNVLALGDNKALMAQRNGEGHVRVYVALRVPEAWTRTSGINFQQPACARADLLEHFTDWAPSVVELLRASDDFFVPRPLYTFPPEQTWQVEPGVTLVGDAAHVMPPFTGRGANMAMLDAVQLSNCLTSGEHGTVGEAFAAYERQMLERMSSVIRETLASQNLLIADNVNAAIARINGRKSIEHGGDR